MRVCILPTQAQMGDASHGIGQVVHAQYERLPKYDIQLVTDPDKAEIIVSHVHRRGLARVDVLHCHGLYWADIPHIEYRNWHMEANQEIAEAVRNALLVTVPSPWVADVFKRDMRLTPRTIGHGINLGEWNVRSHHSSHVLWNKNRNTDVCDASPALFMARRGVSVKSTFPPVNEKVLPPNFSVTGTIPHAKMKELIETADVYLATTPETFGIGTLEAMAAGVPILGYKWAGTADIVEHGEHGYLVDPGDLEGLLQGYHWIIDHRSKLSENARQHASEYDWGNIMPIYADLYHEAMQLRRTESTKTGVTAIVTCYNYADYLPQAINSLLAQTHLPDEIVLVDDGSTDASLKIMQEFGRASPNLIRVIHQANAGVAAARNAGAAAARHPFLICLDADDALDPRFIETLLPPLLTNRGLGIAYSGITLMNESGALTGRTAFPPAFDWIIQATPHVPPSNCIPSACLFRRAMWERAGGWHQEFAPGEDTEFWTRALSIGFDAQRITEDGLFHYRVHSGSASRSKTYKPIDTWMPWMRDKKYPMGAPTKAIVVNSYMNPKVSVIIPVGPAHIEALEGAIRSLLGQTERSWELILVDNTRNSNDLERLAHQRWPFARFFHCRTAGAAAARNIGLTQAQGAFTLFLDADDYLAANALERLLAFYTDKCANSPTPFQYIYPDWYSVESFGGTPILRKSPEFNPSTTTLQHPVTIFIPTALAQLARFDEDLEGWEEWSYAIRLRQQGICGLRCPEPLLYYNVKSGSIRKRSQQQERTILATLKSRYPNHFNLRQEKIMPCGSCPQTAQAIIRAKQSFGNLPTSPASLLPNTDIRMEFIGDTAGTRSFNANGRVYRAGNNTTYRFVNVTKEHHEDIDSLLSTGMFRVVARPTTTPATPAPEAPPAPPPTPVKVIDTRPQPVPQAEQVLAAVGVIAPATADGVTAEQLAATLPESEDRPPAPPPATMRLLRTALPTATYEELLSWSYDERLKPDPRSSFIEEIQREIDKR